MGLAGPRLRGSLNTALHDERQTVSEPAPRRVARAATLGALYGRTEIEVWHRSGASVTFRPGDAPPTEEGLALPIHVVTAWNPLSLPLDQATNHHAQQALLESIAERHLRSAPAVGRALDAGHAEDSVAVWGLSDVEAVGLGARFGQQAIFEIDHDGIHALDCGISDRSGDRLVVDLRPFCSGEESARSAAEAWRALRDGRDNPLRAIVVLGNHAPKADPGWLVMLATQRLVPAAVLP